MDGLDRLRFAPVSLACPLGGVWRVVVTRSDAKSLKASQFTHTLVEQIIDSRPYGTIWVIGNSLWFVEIPMLETHM